MRPSDRPRNPAASEPALRRGFVVLAAALLLVVASTGAAPRASAWANAGDGYGTHDWIVDQALDILDASGKSYAWFDRTKALRATDDPDTVEVEADPTRDIEHVYKDSAKRGGAVQRIADHYSAAIAAHKAGDYADASVQLGMLAHFYGDILQPYHTSAAATTKVSAHYDYELAVNDRTRAPGDASGWSNASQTVSTLSNIRTTAIAGAAYSRARFADLHSAWTASESTSNGTVSRITGEVLKRAAKDLASVIWSVSQGKGEAPDVASLSARVKWIGVKSGEPYQAVYTTAKDAAGRGIEGLEVHIPWPKVGGGTELLRTWTDSAGYVKLTVAVGKLPLLVRQDVPVRVMENGTTTTRTPWFIPSPKLGDGSAGFKTAISDSTPSVGQKIKVTTLARNTSGQPVPGLLVTWTWNYNGKIIKTTGITNSVGRAYSYRTIVSTTTRTTVKITAHTQSYSSNRYSYTSFKRN